MTLEEQETNGNAWQQYQTSRNKYIACKTKFKRWGDILSALSQKFISNPTDVIEQDYVPVPMHPAVVEAINELQTATREFRGACIAAVRANFPVDKKDLAEMGIS